MTGRLEVVGLDGLEAMLRHLPPNARYGAALGMNRTIDEAQSAIRASLPEKFTLRRKQFVERTVYRKPGEDFATKAKLEARVRIHDERDVLAKHEKGGRKVPREGRALAIPVDVRRTKADVVRKSEGVKALFASGKAFRKGSKVFVTQGRGKKKTLRLAYVFKPSVPIAPALGFERTARAVIARRAEANIAGAIEVELTRGLTTKSGPVG